MSCLNDEEHRGLSLFAFFKDAHRRTHTLGSIQFD